MHLHHHRSVYAGNRRTPELAEEPQGSEGAQGADHAHGQHGGAGKGRDGQDDDGGVDHVVCAAEKRGEPVGVEVDEELDDKEAGEAEVEAVQGGGGGGLGAVRAEELRTELGIGDVDREVLLGRREYNVHVLQCVDNVCDCR